MPKSFTTSDEVRAILLAKTGLKTHYSTAKELYTLTGLLRVSELTMEEIPPLQQFRKEYEEKFL